MAALPPGLTESLLEQYGPFAAVAYVLWWRLNKLESHVKDETERLEQNMAKRHNELREAINSNRERIHQSE